MQAGTNWLPSLPPSWPPLLLHNPNLLLLFPLQLSARTQSVPLEKVIDDIAVMGFSRTDVGDGVGWGRGGAGLHCGCQPVCVPVCLPACLLMLHVVAVVAPATSCFCWYVRHRALCTWCVAAQTSPLSPRACRLQVRRVIEEMASRGQSIDINVVVDKLASAM